MTFNNASPSKLSRKRLKELLKILQSVTVKALSFVHRNPTRIFKFLFEKSSVQNEPTVISPELRSIIESFLNDKSREQKIRALSLVVFDYKSKKLIESSGWNWILLWTLQKCKQTKNSWIVWLIAETSILLALVFFLCLNLMQFDWHSDRSPTCLVQNSAKNGHFSDN